MNSCPTKKASLKSNEMLEFPSSKCIITVSVGQPNHEGDKFLATTLAVSKQFASCLIMVCDSLQRYTLKILSTLSLEELHHKSNVLGEEWIKRNSLAIKQLAIPYKISRWDEWLNHPSFPERKSLIDSLYLQDPLFKKSVDDTAYMFSERKMLDAVVDLDTAFHLSKEYLLEECAVMLLQSEQGYQFEIYPSQRNNPMHYVYQEIISYTNKKLMRAVSIKFKNLSPNNLPQKTLVSTI